MLHKALALVKVCLTNLQQCLYINDCFTENIGRS